MKHLFFTLCLLCFALPSWGEVVSSYDLVVRDGLHFKKFSNVPFSGIIEDYHSNGQLRYTGKVTNGKENGIANSYRENGKRYSIINLKNGEQHGVSKWFNKCGYLELLETYKNGLYHGKVEYYNLYSENTDDCSIKSELQFVMNYKNGKLDGISADYENGVVTCKSIYKNDKLVSCDCNCN